MEQKYRSILNENLVQRRSGPQTGPKVHLPTGQSPEAHSQDKAAVALEQLCESP